MVWILGLAWLFGTGESQAWDNPLVKVSNVRINFHVELSTTPDPLRPTAPWYTYFPADPRLMPSPQPSPYPPWPAPFPPPGRPFDVPKDAPKQGATRPQRPDRCSPSTGPTNSPTGPAFNPWDTCRPKCRVTGINAADTDWGG